MRLSCALAVLLTGGFACAQTPAPPARGCNVQHFLANDANLALAAHKYDQASDLFLTQLEKYPDSIAAKTGLIRAEIGGGKLDEALVLANRYLAKSPDDAMLNDALGEVRFRRGEIAEAQIAYNKAMHNDPCLARVHFDIARYQKLAGNFLTAQKQLELAHRLAPEEADITDAFNQSQEKPLTAEEQIALFTRRISKPDVPEDQRKRLENRIATLKAHGNGNCSITTPTEAAKLKLFPVMRADNSVYAVSLEVDLNGNKRRLEVDTGASGLILSRSAAEKAGLTPEADSRIGGIGDQGAKHGFIAHVDKLRIGGLEFHQCEVEVTDTRSLEGTDGLIGTDVFGRWLVTLDMPMREIRLAPLPKRPGMEANDTLQLETQGAAGAEAGVAPADRYIAPEMQDWTKIYRHGHDIIVPARVNDLEAKLFLVDSGASGGDMSLSAAKQVGNLVPVDTVVRGLSGTVANVFTVDKQIMLDFANVRQPMRGITVMDLSGISRGQGFELTGIIGFPTLSELILSIDYRDNLLKAVFDPKHGFHSNGRMEY